MKCLIIAAGEGTRLSDRIDSKPLIPLLDIPLIERVIKTAKEGGCTEFYVVTGYNGEKVRPFLDDQDNRTRANAAKAYYRYDPEKAIVVLKDMARSEDKWMRLSAAWALGEIGDTATGMILEMLLDDNDPQVKNRARLSLEKILGGSGE